jgi:hypothetical protein
MPDLKYILEALRQKPMEPGIYRDPGLPPRRQRGGIMDEMKASNTDTNYRRYVAMQNAMGETPVSFDEWVNHAQK